MSNRNWSNGGKIYAPQVKPILLNCSFVVDATNGNGLGIRSLKGPAISNVFMHTTGTPGVSNGITNPNPASGTIVVQLADNYMRSLCGFNAIVSPVSGTPIVVTSAGAHLVAGTAYIIVSVGTTTTAEWHSLGVPAGVTPAVGVSFISGALTGIGVGSGAVEITAAAGSAVMSIETVGDPNLSINPSPTANQGFGAQFILQCRDAASAIVAPAAGSVISLSFYLSDSSVIVQGQ